MNIEQWCRLDGQIHVAESDEQYKQYAGIKFSENTIEKLAIVKRTNSELFLQSFKLPRELYLSSLENIAETDTKVL